MKKKILFSFLVLFFTLGVAGSALAQANNILNEDPSEKLFEGIQNAFTWAIGLATLLAAVAFLWGAIQFMFLDKLGDGKDTMKNAILGLVLCLSSVVIIRAINPDIITPLNIDSLPPVGGVYLEKNNGDRNPAENRFTVTENMAAIYKKIVYDCQEKDPATTPRLLLTYTQGDASEQDIRTSRVSCNKDASLPAEGTTVFWAFEYPGVYFYTDANCNESYMERLNTTVENFPTEFSSNVKGVIFYTGNGKNKELGIWPTPTPNLIDLSGVKAGPFCGHYTSSSDGERECIPMGQCSDAIKSALIFNLPDKPEETGNSVVFYSKPAGWTRVGAGQIVIPASRIGKRLLLDPAGLEFRYASPNPDDEHQKNCKTFKDCPASIEIIGGYLVDLTFGGEKDENGELKNEKGKIEQSSGIWTKYFLENAVDLAASNTFNPAYNNFASITIIPIIN